MPQSYITVLGAGTWGVAVGSVLAFSPSNNVVIWSPTGRNLPLLRTGVHPKLAGFRIPSQIQFPTDYQLALEKADFVFFAVSSDHLETVLKRISSAIKEDQILISLVKGLNDHTLQVPSETIAKYLPHNRLVVLTGPSHAEEVVKGLPFGLEMASKSNDAMDMVSEIFAEVPVFLPRTHDVIGAELGGALKNILAIGYGISRGMGLGANFNALLATLGLKEIRSIIVAKGGKEETVLSLCCFGDLLTTIGSKHSRNRKFGELIGEGVPLNIALKEVSMVVEGINAIKGALKIARKDSLKVPIIELVDEIMEGKRSLADFPKLISTLKQIHTPIKV